MARSIGSRIVVAVVCAVAVLALAASTASARNYGQSGRSTVSCNSTAGGIGHAYRDTPAGDQGRGNALYYAGQEC